MKKSLKILALSLAAIFLFALLVKVGPSSAMVLLTFFMGLAIAGPSSWLSWTVVCLIANAVLAAIFYLLTKIPMDGVMAGVLAFGVMPLIPAFFLWLAHLLRRSKGRSLPAINAER